MCVIRLLLNLVRKKHLPVEIVILGFLCSQHFGAVAKKKGKVLLLKISKCTLGYPMYDGIMLKILETTCIETLLPICCVLELLVFVHVFYV